MPMTNKTEDEKARKEDEKEAKAAAKEAENAPVKTGLVEDINSMVHPSDDDPVTARGSGTEGVPAGTEDLAKAAEARLAADDKAAKEAAKEADKAAKRD